MTRTAIPLALRRLVWERARGQCEYCLTPESVVLIPHEIDHVIAQKHGGSSDPDNLALACVLCNQHKGTDIASLDPETRSLTPLYNPRRDIWREHFDLQGSRLLARTPVGRVTVRLLQLNNPTRIAERELLLAAEALRIPD
jgi:hypothetical protein